MPPPSPTTTLPPVRIDHYEVHDELARGGMGVVYRATDTRSGAKVVVKLLKVDSEKARRRLRREAKAMRRLTHPSVLALYDDGEHEGRPYLVLPYVEGESLQDRLDREGTLSVDDAVDIAIQVGGGLRAAHQLGLLHRDVKPDNVLVDGHMRGAVKLTDFGLVKDTDPGRSASTSLSVRGQFLGTPGYWPPEQAFGRLVLIGPASDVYALGALLYALLSGHPPRPNDTLPRALQAFDTPPPPLLDAPDWLDDLIQRCLADDVAARPPLDAVLDTLQAHAPLPAPAGHAPPPAPPPERAARGDPRDVEAASRTVRGRPRGRWLRIALGLALGVGLSLSTWLLWASDSSGAASPKEFARLRDALLAYRPRPDLRQLEDELYAVNQNADSPEQKQRAQDLLHLLEERKGLEDTVRAVEQAKNYAQVQQQLREFRLAPESPLEAMRRVEYARLALRWGAPERALNYAGGPAPSDARLAHERRLLTALARWLQGEREAVNGELEELGTEGEDLPCEVAKALYLLTRTNPERERNLIGLTLEAAEALGEPDYVPLLLGQAWRLALEGRAAEAYALIGGRDHPLLAITRVGLTFEGGPSFEEATAARRAIDNTSDRGVAYEADLALAMRSKQASDRQRGDLIVRLDVIAQQGLSDDQMTRACLWAALLVDEELVARRYLLKARALDPTALRWAVETLEFKDPETYRRYELRARW